MNELAAVQLFVGYFLFVGLGLIAIAAREHFRK
jgi:hypothetical protein